MKTVFTFLAILFLSFSMTASVYGNLYPNKGAWVEGEITNPSGTTYYGGYGTESLPGPTFGIGNTQSYIDVYTGESGLAAQSEANFGGETYVKGVSHYYDTFTIHTSTTTPVHINISLGMSYRFISPTIGWYPKAGEAGFSIVLNADGAMSKTLKIFHSEDHTTGGWDGPGYGSISLANDLGQYLVWWCGRSDMLFRDGDQVSLAFEYYTWAKNGATVDSLHTGDFKFLLPDEIKNAGGYLEVTSPSGYYQLDGVKPVKITGALELLLLD
jgi:hypothetical protein